MPRTTTRPKAEQNSARRDQILQIAARLIAQRGYSATTVRDIADEAGILSGSLYHHFSSKEAILEEILRSFMSGLLGRLDQIAASGGTPREILDRFIEQAFETIEREPDVVGLYQHESAFLATQPGFEFLAEGSHQIERLWLAQIEQGQRAGQFRTGFDPAVTYRFIRDAVWATVAWYRPGRGQTAVSLSATFLDLLHGGILAD